MACLAEGALAEDEDLGGGNREDERLAVIRMLKGTFTNLEAPPAILFVRPRFGQPLEAVALCDSIGIALDDDV